MLLEASRGFEREWPERSRRDSSARARDIQASGRTRSAPERSRVLGSAARGGVLDRVEELEAPIRGWLFASSCRWWVRECTTSRRAEGSFLGSEGWRRPSSPARSTIPMRSRSSPSASRTMRRHLPQRSPSGASTRHGSGMPFHPRIRRDCSTICCQDSHAGAVRHRSRAHGGRHRESAANGILASVRRGDDVRGQCHYQQGELLDRGGTREARSAPRTRTASSCRWRSPTCSRG